VNLVNPLNFQAAIEVVRSVGAQLRQGLATRYPDIAWLDGELEGVGFWRTPKAGRFWVCDAIDGAVRNLGPTSLQIAYVASGRLDALWEYGEDTFNCLGGALLVTEAGLLATCVAASIRR